MKLRLYSLYSKRGCKGDYWLKRAKISNMKRKIQELQVTELVKELFSSILKISLSYLYNKFMSV